MVLYNLYEQKSYDLETNETHCTSLSRMAGSEYPLVWLRTKCLWFQAELFLTSSSNSSSTYSSSPSNSYTPVTHRDGPWTHMQISKPLHTTLDLDLYLDDPLPVLPRVVVLGILTKNFCYKLQLFRRVVQPLDHHPPVMPVYLHKFFNNNNNQQDLIY